MFTGIIEEVGTINNISPIAGGIRLIIRAEKILADIKVDDSICVSGVCLTVIKFSKTDFQAEAVGETLKKSTLAKSKPGEAVNLERALKLSDRLGGHMVQGHVNGIGRIEELQKKSNNWFAGVQVPDKLTRYIVDEGSIAIDGVSLTVAKITGNYIEISIIPHTFQNTIISKYKIGQEVNIEVDFMAKYVENLLKNYKNQSKKQDITENWLKEIGY